MRKVVYHAVGDPNPEKDIPYGYVTVQRVRDPSVTPNLCRPRLTFLAPDHSSEFLDTATNWASSAWLSHSWRQCDYLIPCSISTAKDTAGAIYAIHGGPGTDWELYFSMVEFP